MYKLIQNIILIPLIIVLVTAFFLNLFYLNSTKASFLHMEDFDGRFLGNVCTQDDFSCGGNATSTVQNATYSSYPQGLQFYTSSALATNYVQYEMPTVPSHEIWTMWLRVTTGGGNATTIGFLDASSTIHDFVSIEGTGDVYVNGIDSNKNITSNEWFELTAEVATTSEGMRIKIGTSTWSGVKNYAPGNHVTKYIRFYTNASTNISYVDSISYQGYYNEADVEIIELPDWEGTVSVESEHLLQYDRVNYCTIGYSCQIWVNYNSNSVGYTVYLTEDDADRYDVSGAIDWFEPINQLSMQDYFTVLPAETTHITKEYCVIAVDHPTLTDWSDCNVQVIWNYENTFLDNVFTEYDCDTICDSISTTSDSFWDGARYGIECGFRKVICWSFVPNDDSLVKFAKSVYTLQNAFPFTIYTQVEDTIKGVDLDNASTTLSMNWSTFGLPMDQDIVIASTTQMSGTFGNLWDKIYFIMQSSIYISFFFYILFRIMSMAKKRHSEA